jgi:hypothetical protein
LADRVQRRWRKQPILGIKRVRTRKAQHQSIRRGLNDLADRPPRDELQQRSAIRGEGAQRDDLAAAFGAHRRARHQQGDAAAPLEQGSVRAPALVRKRRVKPARIDPKRQAALDGACLDRLGGRRTAHPNSRPTALATGASAFIRAWN